MAKDDWKRERERLVKLGLGTPGKGAAATVAFIVDNPLTHLNPPAEITVSARVVSTINDYRPYFLVIDVCLQSILLPESQHHRARGAKMDHGRMAASLRAGTQRHRTELSAT